MKRPISKVATIYEVTLSVDDVTSLAVARKILAKDGHPISLKAEVYQMHEEIGDVYFEKDTDSEDWFLGVTITCKDTRTHRAIMNDVVYRLLSYITYTADESSNTRNE